jgi:hypothetical protein
MDPITAIHTLEALQRDLPPGSDRARALQAGIEALWAQISTQRKLAAEHGSDESR